MYYLIEYIDNYSKTSVRLCQYCRDETALDNNGATVNFADKNTTDSF